MANGHPAGFSVSPADICEQILAFEHSNRIRPGEEVRTLPLVDFLQRPDPHGGFDPVSKTTVVKWLRAWAMPMPPWPRGFIDDQGRAVLVSICDARPPYLIHWISPNCEELLGYSQDYYHARSNRLLRTSPDGMWRQTDSMHMARLAAHAAPNTPFTAETALMCKDGLELPVLWTIRYGEHRTAKGPRPIGTYFCSSTVIADKRLPLRYLQQQFIDEQDNPFTNVPRWFEENDSLRSVTVGRDQPGGPMYVEVKGSVTLDDLKRRVRSLHGHAHGTSTTQGRLDL